MRHFIEVKISHPMKCSTEIIEVWKRGIMVDFPKNTIAYRCFDTDRYMKFGENYTGWTYFGQEYSFLEVCELFKKAQELLPQEPKKESIFEDEEDDAECSSFKFLGFIQKNMQRFGWRRAVKACDGRWYPLLEGDVVASPFLKGETEHEE